MSKRDFLVEIGTEELPPLALPELEAAFAEGIRKGLGDASLSHGEVRSFATPRRLAVLVRELGALYRAFSQGRRPRSDVFWDDVTHAPLWFIQRAHHAVRSSRFWACPHSPATGDGCFTPWVMPAPLEDGAEACVRPQPKDAARQILRQAPSADVGQAVERGLWVVAVVLARHVA